MKYLNMREAMDKLGLPKEITAEEIFFWAETPRKWSEDELDVIQQVTNQFIWECKLRMPKPSPFTR